MIEEMPWWIALCNAISRENRFKGIKVFYKKRNFFFLPREKENIRMFKPNFM